LRLSDVLKVCRKHWLNIPVYKDVDGIWCANDVMAVGALQALRAKSLEGKVKVAGVDAISDILNDIKKGEAVVTLDINPWAQGGFGLAWAYAAWKGDIVPSQLPREKRMFHTKHMVITKSNVDDYISKFVDSKPVLDFSHIESVVTRPMEDFK